MKGTVKVDKRISIIIPAYNAEKTLKRTVESIVSDVKSYCVEIIIVENGSTDSTLYVAKKLKGKYENVSVYQSKKGVSNARNLGIEKASGEWIVFVDSDDLMCDGAITILCNKIQNSDRDLYLFSYKKNHRTISLDEANNKNVEQLICMVLENPTKFSTVWAKLFRNEVIKTNNIRFDETLALSEDSVFLMEYLHHCNKVAICKEIIYIYQIVGDSVTRGYSGKRKEQYLTALKRAREIFRDERGRIEKSFAVYTAMQLNLIMVKEIFDLHNGMRLKDEMQELKRIASIKEIAEEISKVHFREYPFIRIIPIELINKKLYFGAAIIFVLKNTFNCIKRHEVFAKTKL